MAFIKLHGNNNEEIYINIDNIAYMKKTDGYYQSVIYVNFPACESHKFDYQQLHVKETPEEIMEIINNAVRPVSGNPNLLQKS